MRISSNADYQTAYQKSIDNPEAFWNEIAQNFTWRQPWHTTLNWNFTEPKVEWFVGGQLNITENCIDRHLPLRANKTAIIWEPNDPNKPNVRISYAQLYEQVCQMANLLLSKGISKGDRVVLYMPMIPQLAVGVLACARIGAVHSVVFGGFSSQALADRINGAQAKLIITADAILRGAKQIPCKSIVDEALLQCHSVQTVLVANRCNTANLYMQANRDFYLEPALEKCATHCPAQTMDSEDPLFILYTSGSTGKPKGIVHTCGGYMVFMGYTFLNVFQYNEPDIFWCTADIGWVTGHSYSLYGPLLNGATTVLFEGVPTYPDAGRFWSVIDKLGVTQFYTAPTAIRSLMGEGEAPIKPYNLQSLKTIGSVGEPINEEAWHWYSTHIGKNRCPVVDTWWQTETGGILISALSGISATKPTYAGQPLPGVQPVLLDAQGNEITENNTEGLLCIKFPWPSIVRTIYGDHESCRQIYFAPFKNYYFTGDGAKRDDNGMFRIIGRVDDVINVSGHRIGTAEIENAIDEDENVIESAVVGYPHPIKGQGIYAYVICQTTPAQNSREAATIRQSITAMVEKQIGKLARPDKILFVTGLPKTRSGKIMRRILRKIAEGQTDQLGDTTTLLDPSVVIAIQQSATQLE